MAELVDGWRARGVARALLVIGCLSGLGIYITTPFASPDQLMLATDVYQHAAGRMLEGDSIYHTAPASREGYFYLYPPIVTVLFVPHALLGSLTAAFVLQTLLNLFAAVGTALFVVRLLDRRGIAPTRLDRGLLVAFFVLSSYSAIQFINGQVNLWLAFAFAVGLDAVDRRAEPVAGVAFGLAALIKVFPAVMGLWLLRVRAWRAVGSAVATGLAGLVLGTVLLGPRLTVTYLTDVLAGRFTGSTYEGRPAAAANVDGIHRQLAAVWPGGARWHTLIGALVLGLLLLASFRRVETRRQRDVAALATIAAILLFLPLQPLYFPLVAVPLLVLLYDLPAGRAGWVLATGAAASMIHLDQESVALLVAMSPLPAAIDGAISGAASAAFRVVLPPTFGLWLLLIACVVLQWRGRSLRRPVSEEVRLSRAGGTKGDND